MVKFAISGTHSTGKSTLASVVGEVACDVTLVGEVPRAICEQTGDPRFFHRDRNTFAKQTLLVARQIAEESSAASAGKVVVTDRCVVDHWAYTQEQFPLACADKAGAQWDALIREWMATFEAVFVVGPEGQLQNDGVREQDDAFQTAIDLRIRELLDEVGVNVVELRGSTNERARAFFTVSSIAVKTGTML